MCSGPFRARSVPSVSKPTPAKPRPGGFVKPTPARLCSRWDGQLCGNSPGCLGIYQTFVMPTQSGDSCCMRTATVIILTQRVYPGQPHPRRPSKHGESVASGAVPCPYRKFNRPTVKVFNTVVSIIGGKSYSYSIFPLRNTRTLERYPVCAENTLIFQCESPV